MKRTTRAIGKEYEDLACAYLIEKGYTIAERNFTMRGGEIDIIAKQNGTVVFVEVRYRADDKHGSPLETVTAHKQRRICRTAQFYLLRHGYPGNVNIRFDVIAVTGEKASHIENAFEFAF
ncbi:MAG: YraN family protein [Lachnospiraceae bacterium]|nr:YraN family protein [Lachnospiraceae bacterium]